MIKSFTYSFLSLMFLITAALTAQENTFTSYDLLRMKYVVETSISPDGNFIAYTVHIPRQLTEKPGKHYRYLYLYDLANEKSVELLEDKVFISSIGWMPDSKSITFRAKFNDDKYTQVYQLPIDSGEPAAITNSVHSVLQYQFSKDGNQLAFVSTSVVSEEKQNLLESGLTPDQLIFYGLEYKFVTQFVIGEITHPEMVMKLNIAIHQFAKRQMTWFRRIQKNGVKIHWIDGELAADEKISAILKLFPV